MGSMVASRTNGLLVCTTSVKTTSGVANFGMRKQTLPGCMKTRPTWGAMNLTFRASAASGVSSTAAPLPSRCWYLVSGFLTSATFG